MKEQGTMHFQQRNQEMMKELGERQIRKTLKIHLKITEKQLTKKKKIKIRLTKFLNHIISPRYTTMAHEKHNYFFLGT